MKFLDKDLLQVMIHKIILILLQELMLAMKWARLNNVPFPNIDPTVVDREGLKECYVFENPHDPRCPIVMHFVLVNITFREEKAPGMWFLYISVGCRL